MTAPDRVERGSIDKYGRESIRFIKGLSNGVVVVVEQEYKNSPNDMKLITMWANTSSSKAPTARHTTPVKFDVRNAILSTEDAAKIKEDAIAAIEKDNYMQKMTAWHGSPYAFDAFDHTKMGTGEGAQVHGWGTYVAKDRSVGNRYAYTIGERQYKGKGLWGNCFDAYEEWKAEREKKIGLQREVGRTRRQQLHLKT